MTELPFGGFNAALPHSSSECANRLVKIANRMACGQAVRVGLTPQGEINADRFMRALGLMNSVGNDGKYSAVFKAHWSSRYIELKSYQPRNAFKTLQGEMAAAGVDPMPSRSTVNAWVDHSNVPKRPA